MSTPDKTITINLTAEESRKNVIVFGGTIPPEEWSAFFKKHFVPFGPGSNAGKEARAKTTGSCEDYGCPHTFPGTDDPITGCEVTILGGRVVSVRCWYGEPPTRKE